MNPILLDCGFTQIPYVINGATNNQLSKYYETACEHAFVQLEKERLSDRLYENYSSKNLKLSKMFLYSIIYDEKAKSPVFITGVQKIGKYSARAFSRYYMFANYRTNADNGLLKKIDNFEVLQNEIALTHDYFPFLFWSRDKGSLFFKKLKNSRSDIFSNWEVYPKKIELLYPDNFHGIFYLNRGSQSADFYIDCDLLLHSKKP